MVRTTASLAAVLVVAGGALLVSGPAEAGDYLPGVYKVRDIAQPPPGHYFQLINYYYSTDTLKDRNGRAVNTIELPGGIIIPVDVDVDLYALVPAYALVSNKKLFGANWGGSVLTWVATSSFDASIASARLEDDVIGLGDLFISPVQLGWHFPAWDLTWSWGVYAPIGKFDADEFDNTGLGAWENQFQLGGVYYFDKQRLTAASLIATYEIVGNKKGTDLEPGDVLSLEYGASRTFVPSMWEIGISGYSTWQVSDDKGADAVRPEVHDEVHAVGLQISRFNPKRMMDISLRVLGEYNAKARTEGSAAILTFAWVL